MAIRVAAFLIESSVLVALSRYHFAKIVNEKPLRMRRRGCCFGGHIS
jgi:hypothetical protein